MKVTDARLARIEGRANAATPPPWKRFGGERLGIDSVETPDRKEVVAWPGFDSSAMSNTQDRRNATFIAHAREDVPDLVANLRESRTAIRAALEKLTPMIWNGECREPCNVRFAHGHCIECENDETEGHADYCETAAALAALTAALAAN